MRIERSSPRHAPPQGTPSSADEILLHWLGRDHCASRVLLRAGARHPPAPGDWRHFRGGNLVGIGYGAKETAGAVTGDVAVRIYVKQKMPRRELAPRDRAPGTVNGIATDVIAVGTPAFHARPVSFGAGISHIRGELGSLGCIVTRPPDADWHVLSACHVLALAGAAAAGDRIVEPAATKDDGSPNAAATPLATLEDFEPLSSDGRANPFDAAIARLDRNADVSIDIPTMGSPQADPAPATLFQSVRKYGAGTGPTLGVVTDPDSRITLTLGESSYLFGGVVQVLGAGGPFSAGGDSGALVVDAPSRRPVGLVIGGVGQRTFVSPIQAVLARFNAQLVV